MNSLSIACKERHILFLTKYFDAEVYAVLQQVLGHLSPVRQNLHYYFNDTANNQIAKKTTPEDRIHNFQEETHEFLINYVVTIGGDGTILYAAGLFQKRDTPYIFPIEKGTLGFLCKFGLQDLSRTVSQFGNSPSTSFSVQKKMRINCAKLAGQQVAFHYNCLNEIAISRYESPHKLKLDIFLQNKYFTSTMGDGLIICTPTGSTAYSLSAGGPIIHNDLNTITLVPLCPNSMSFRPICLPGSVVITIKVAEDSRANGYVSCDGQKGIKISREEQIVIQTSDLHVNVLSEDTEDTKYDQWSVKLKELLNWNITYKSKVAPKLTRLAKL